MPTATITKAPANRVSEEDLRASVEELLDEIINGDDSCWQRYAEQMAQETAAGFKLGLFKVWSSTNRLHLAAQVRHRGTQVHGMFAGVDQWRKRNRSVREGEEPYIIFGPPTYLRRAAQQGAAAQTQAGQPNQPTQQQQPSAQQQANAQQPAPQVCFRRPPAIEVFDYTQTVSDNPDFIEPDWAVPLAGGDLSTLETLVQISPVPVVFTDIGSKIENGWLTKAGITVDASMPVGNQIWTLTHELSHFHLGHLDRLASTKPGEDDQDERAQCEQEAALAQYFTMKMLGLDESVGVNVTAAAGAYLRSWIKDNGDGTTTPIAGYKGRRKLLKQRFDVAFRAAQAIAAAYAQADTL